MKRGILSPNMTDTTTDLHQVIRLAFDQHFMYILWKVGSYKAKNP